jgi:hypothetical protein
MMKSVMRTTSFKAKWSWESTSLHTRWPKLTGSIYEGADGRQTDLVVGKEAKLNGVPVINVPLPMVCEYALCLNVAWAHC